MNEWTYKDRKIRLLEGNIALVEAEAIVNAANKSLQLGGGVAGAIRKLGGPCIQKECDRLAPIATGEAVITGAGQLKAKYVIHAVGPVWGEGGEEKKLAKATESSLAIALKKKIQTVAFPAISAGIFGFPLERCSQVMLATAMGFVKRNNFPREIIFCLFGQEAFSVFRSTLSALAAEKQKRE
jgi:O-acetyl-ADP-ribose deacetylase (regulator of RNase III)